MELLIFFIKIWLEKKIIVHSCYLCLNAQKQNLSSYKSVQFICEHSSYADLSVKGKALRTEAKYKLIRGCRKRILVEYNEENPNCKEPLHFRADSQKNWTNEDHYN